MQTFSDTGGISEYSELIECCQVVDISMVNICCTNEYFQVEGMVLMDFQNLRIITLLVCSFVCRCGNANLALEY